MTEHLTRHAVTITAVLALIDQIEFERVAGVPLQHVISKKLFSGHLTIPFFVAGVL